MERGPQDLVVRRGLYPVRRLACCAHLSVNEDQLARKVFGNVPRLPNRRVAQPRAPLYIATFGSIKTVEWMMESRRFGPHNLPADSSAEWRRPSKLSLPESRMQGEW